MERRGFLLGLAGGLAALAIGIRPSEAAPARPDLHQPERKPEPDIVQEVSEANKAAIEAADKDFSQYYYRRPVRRVYYRAPVRRVYYRRPVRRVYYRPVRARPVYYRRPVRRVYYRRPVRVIRYY
jgi:hypothetical protein